MVELDDEEWRSACCDRQLPHSSQCTNNDDDDDDDNVETTRA